jgi:glycosyltransferase involved in cell wall biosynthesis
MLPAYSRPVILTTFFFFILSHYIRGIDEYPLVAIVCCYNNAKWAEKNLASICNQKYKNFRVIITDDGSTDGTAEIIRDYIERHHLGDRVILLENEKRRRKLANVYRAVHQCKDTEIVLLIDGDDWLINSSVFRYINLIYHTFPDTWFTYGQYHNIPTSEAHQWGFSEHGYCVPVPKDVERRHAYRAFRFIFMHLRTFPAWIFKLILLQDLLCDSISQYKGNFYPASNDNAIFFPIVEMSHMHTVFVDKVLYIRNLYSELVGFKVDRKLQRTCSREIRRRKRYRPLEQKIYLAETCPQPTTDIIILYDKFTSSGDINTLLQSIGSHVHNGNTVVIVISKHESLKIKETGKYPVSILQYDPTTRGSIASTLKNHLETTHANYCLLITTDTTIHDTFDCKTMVAWLEQTQAYAFYTHHSLPKQAFAPWLVVLYDTVCCWKYKHAKGMWKIAYTCNCTLYRKTDVIKLLDQTHQSTVNDLILQLKLIKPPGERIGLFFEHAKSRITVPSPRRRT